ncbi:ABC transporter substrate-binding protein [Dissulfurispira thermophila]|uniref:ABC transporter substrate-binding protein n=1 Tax=Dissulfurispira thermophila TaxID=2715679 RepID=UPI00193EA735|nr:ABC transporter substrate-binding protein [Dissulfurispira thermophila]
MDRLFAHHLFCLLAVILFLFSCTSSDRLEGYIYYRLNTNPTTLDPALIVDVSSASIAAKLFNGLVRLNDRFEVSPDIAKRWEISRNGLRYKFFLKKGVRFSNGREVKAQDFKYSFERILELKTKSPNTWVFDKVEGAKEFQKGQAKEVKGFKVADDYTFEIKLRMPFSPFLSMLTMTPAYVIPKEEAEKWGNDFASHPSGTGPFTLKNWLTNRELVLEKNEDYFDKKARVRGIVYKIIPEDLTTITEFELGNIDVISLPGSAYSKFKNNKKWNKYIMSLKGLNTYYLGMNLSRPPFNNLNLRKAVFYAIDREKILETFYEGRGRLAAGPVPDLLRKWDVKAGVNYNPEISKEIIRREGLSGVKVNMYVTADQDVIDLAEIIQAYISEVGINVNIKQLEWSAYKDAVNKGEPDMFWLSWWADYPDPENFLFPLFHSSNIGPAGNRTRYINKEVDTLIERGQNSINENDRNNFYKMAEELIIQDMPWMPFWHRTDFLIKQPWIKDYKVYPIYTMDKGIEVAIER